MIRATICEASQGISPPILAVLDSEWYWRPARTALAITRALMACTSREPPQRRQDPATVPVMNSRLVIAWPAAAALALAGCGISTPAAYHSHAPSASAAVSQAASIPGGAPAAAVVCERFRALNTAEAKANPGSTNQAALRRYGNALMLAPKPLVGSRSRQDRALARDIQFAGGEALALSLGYFPHGAQAAYARAGSAIKTAGRDCRERGY
ncbi:MAG: hypothetical protein M3Y33_09180 [Actinomycetota bacterium]|nr:hypothetical protein [Actinomycetota bacterium]